MKEQHTVIYVMRHIDIGGYIDIPYKKVGITGSGNATLTSRLLQISSTKSPIKAQCIAAWEYNDARAVENAIHLLLEDSRIEGEWFIDKDDTLVERMQPIMDLLGAKEITIKGDEDTYTSNILKKESELNTLSNQTLLGEISEILNEPLRTSIRKSGPTFFGDNLTYYIGHRKSGNHKLVVGRSNKIFDKLSSFLEEKSYDVEKDSKGNVSLIGLSSPAVADVINIIESEFKGAKIT